MSDKVVLSGAIDNGAAGMLVECGIHSDRAMPLRGILIAEIIACKPLETRRGRAVKGTQIRTRDADIPVSLLGLEKDKWREIGDLEGRSVIRSGYPRSCDGRHFSRAIVVRDAPKLTGACPARQNDEITVVEPAHRAGQA